MVFTQVAAIHSLMVAALECNLTVLLPPGIMSIISNFHPGQDRLPAQFQTLTSSPDTYPSSMGPYSI